MFHYVDGYLRYAGYIVKLSKTLQVLGEKDASVNVIFVTTVFLVRWYLVRYLIPWDEICHKLDGKCCIGIFYFKIKVASHRYFRKFSVISWFSSTKPFLWGSCDQELLQQSDQWVIFAGVDGLLSKLVTEQTGHLGGPKPVLARSMAPFFQNNPGRSSAAFEQFRGLVLTWTVCTLPHFSM